MQALMDSLSHGMAAFFSCIPQVMAAMLMFAFAALLANFVAGIVRDATGNDILAKVARYGIVAQYSIIVFAAFAALMPLEIAPQLVAPTFLILLAAVAGAVALAFGWRAGDRRKLIARWGSKGADGAKQKAAMRGVTTPADGWLARGAVLTTLVEKGLRHGAGAQRRRRSGS